MRSERCLVQCCDELAPIHVAGFCFCLFRRFQPGHALSQVQSSGPMPGVLDSRGPKMELQILLFLVHFWFTSPSRRARRAVPLQDTILCCAQASIPVQTAYAKAHLQFVSLCCPSTLLESVVIRSVIGYYVAPGLHNIALSWLSQWVLLHDTKGFRRVSTVPM